MAAVELDHITKVYPNGVRAVSDLCLRVADGELLVIVGPSGCGKTTTLRLIAGLEAPTEGSISIDNQCVDRLPPRDRDVALVFQRSTLYPHLSVRRNLAFGLEMRNGRKRFGDLLRRFLPAPRSQTPKRQGIVAERVAHAANLLGLENVLDRRPGELSGGQQQRVALGRALVRQPKVFLLDEPLSHLDGRLRAELRRELHLLQRRLQTTMIYVTHDQAEALTLADRVVVMDRGVAQQVDRPLAVYERPCNRFVAEFIGWPPMNFVDGLLALIGGTLCFTAFDWVLPVPAEKASVWAAFPGQPVTLGIRPEEIRLSPCGPADSKLAVQVVLVEPLGHEFFVTFQYKEWQATARLVGRQDVEPKQNVEVFFNMMDAHLFDRSTGLTLNNGRPAG